MPYITKQLRDEIDDGAAPESPGELNYAISHLIQTYVKSKGLSYSAINDVVGALEGAKLEFYRRVAAPYEDKKIIQNGDVYPPGWTEPGN